MDHLFLGSIAHSKSLNDLETIENGFIAVKSGKIIAIGDQSALPNEYLTTLPVTKLSKSQFLLPGFIDCHIHVSLSNTINFYMSFYLIISLNIPAGPTISKYWTWTWSASLAMARNVYIPTRSCLQRQRIRHTSVWGDRTPNNQLRHNFGCVFCHKLSRKLFNPRQTSYQPRSTCSYWKGLLKYIVASVLYWNNCRITARYRIIY